MKIKLKKRFLIIAVIFIVLVICLIAYLPTYSEFTSKVSQGSGIVENIVYINDLESDWNYYLGKNYTNTVDNTFPTGASSNIYNENSLVQVQLNYNSTETLSDGTKLTGYVSNTEKQDTYVYSKYYPVKTDFSGNYIEIELIDNPFTDRPNDYGFNGWTTNYSGATTSIDTDIYTRYLKVPITYSNGIPSDITINLNASWVNANVVYGSSSNYNFSAIFNTLDAGGMKEIKLSRTIYDPFDMTGFFKKVELSRGDSYVGYYNDKGEYQSSGTCNSWWSSCTMYQIISNEYYNERDKYFMLKNGVMAEVTSSDLDLTETTVIDKKYINSNMAGHFIKEVVPVNNSLAGYYNNLGELQTGGTCNSNSGCDYYKLLQFYDDAGNEQIISPDITYYYLVTRDTNILVFDGSTTTTWGNYQTKPVTVTGLHNDKYYSSASWTSSSYLKCGADATIENLLIKTAISNSNESPTSYTTGAGYIYGMWNNLKIGRNIGNYNGFKTMNGIIGGGNNSTGSSGAITRYKTTIESGKYNNFSLSNGTYTGAARDYIEGKAILGNDYDRVTKNNNNLDFYYCVSGSWGGYIYNDNGIALSTTVKSGIFGSGKYDYTTGIYVGGRAYGTHYATKELIYEGGYTYNINGGPLTDSSRSNSNDAFIYMKGGEVDAIFGGAGATATYGHRLLQVTGGTVNYAVFGGSNGYQAGSNEGTVRGNGYVYVGGNATIGNQVLIDNKSQLYGADSGSVFGIGNGKSGQTTIGSSDNSVVIIDGDAKVLGNVYGGGNFGATGINSLQNATSTTISIPGGTINGSVYGGGNMNGSGSSSKTATININMTNGKVLSSIYGGSNQSGTIYGSTNININGGTVDNSIYGGGQGGPNGSSSQGTFVSGNVNINIGDKSTIIKPTINKNIYGGSAYGTVNGTNTSNGLSGFSTRVTINDGIVNGSVFGGAEGSSVFKPYVLGNIDVNINGGNINRVFGGNDSAGTINGDSKVYLNDGIINSVFGGGNKTNSNNTYVYLRGANTTNIYGGSNEIGTVSNTLIETTSGRAINIYGGNNIGGTTDTTSVTINGGVIGTVYGGGSLAETNITEVNLNKGQILDCYGGGESANVKTSTKVNLNGAAINNIYGGSNKTGNIPKATIVASSGETKYIYGGNNIGGKTTETNIIVNGAVIENAVYGGGNVAKTDKSNITLNKSGNTINSIFGGGKSASVEDTNIIINGSSQNNVFGGSDVLGTVNTSTIEIIGGNTDNLYGGNNKGGSTLITNIKATSGKVNNYIYGGGKESNTTTSNISIENNFIGVNNLFGGGESADVATSNIKVLGGNISNLFGGSNTNGEVNTASINIAHGVFGDVYGGNNRGGSTKSPTINISGGTVNNVYGGGNAAVTNNPTVNITGGKFINEIYGGGNQAAILEDTTVNIKDAVVEGNIFGGGNAGGVLKNTDLYISSTSILGSVYAGGNGATAIVDGNTLLNIDGTTIIKNHIFGGGNAAATGNENTNNSTSTLNIVGVEIEGNIYGGANTSVLYGTTTVNIGSNVVTDKKLVSSSIKIGGTIFGGGEANATGDENYDYSFISVTKGITINIDGKDHDHFIVKGSIFGSGNASSTTGFSIINISNYGTRANFNINTSIQRADILNLDNAHIELEGATDRTNEYSTTLFSVSRINEIKMYNNSTLYFMNGANLLKVLSSYALIDGNFEKAVVDIDYQNKKVTRNVDNRIYMYAGKNLNIATNENVTSYGEANGMTFFGMYDHDRNGKAITALYNASYDYGSGAPGGDLYHFDKGSYILGLHTTNHDTKKDGFYSNYEDENNAGHIKVDYIEPTPEDAKYYMWVIGETVVSYDISLTASKYSTLGTHELSLLNYFNPNTMFTIIGFDYNGLDKDVSLVEETNIPRIAQTSEEADKKMSLAMKTNNSGWITKGSTTFLTNEDKPYTGTVDYQKENSTLVPSLVFYLYHSKNLNTSGSMGEVTISLLVSTPIDDLNNKVERVNINVNLSRALYATNEYEAALTPGKEYDMFASSNVNITNKSSFSSYFSLYAESEKDFYKPGYNHVITSSYALPVKTKITMIDLFDKTNPEYYYHVIDNDDYNKSLDEINNTKEASYKLEDFLKMGSTNTSNNYSDEKNNERYYNSTEKSASEEFIFIVDFSESNINENILDKSFLLELRDVDDKTLVSVLGVQHDAMRYNLYNDKDASINVKAKFSEEQLYIGEKGTLNVETNFVQDFVGSDSIYDTHYFEQQLGIKISIFDENGIQHNGADLLGVTFTCNGTTYYPRHDGSIRFNLAERVANISTNIIIDTKNSTSSSGIYTIKVESFASPDGIYYGLISSSQTDVKLKILNTKYGLDAIINDNQTLINKETGFNMNNNNISVFEINHESALEKPNIHISLYRRDYNSIYTTDYNLVDLKDYITNTLVPSSKEKEYIAINNPASKNNLFFYFKPNLVSGTYKVVFSLYDSNTYIGDVSKYLVIK